MLKTIIHRAKRIYSSASKLVKSIFGAILLNFSKKYQKNRKFPQLFLKKVLTFTPSCDIIFKHKAMAHWSSGQDASLSRWKLGFDSRMGHHKENTIATRWCFLYANSMESEPRVVALAQLHKTCGAPHLIIAQALPARVGSDSRMGHQKITFSSKPKAHGITKGACSSVPKNRISFIITKLVTVVGLHHFSIMRSSI